MSGRQAAKEILAKAEREEFIGLAVLARALGKDYRTVLRDWEARHHPYTRVGRDYLLYAPLVLQTYFPHRSSGADLR
jgi:hypothetical protein